MKRCLVHAFAFALLLAVSSCKKTGVNDVAKNGTGVAENLKIRMAETVDSVKRTLTFNCYTEKIYPCINFGIETTCTVTNDKISVSFVKIISPNICLTALGPASTVIGFDQLENKSYQLDLVFGTEKISGQLNVSPGSFVASLPAQPKVEFVNPDLKRIPANTVYGTVHYHAAATGSVVQEFIDSLQAYGASPRTYAEGDYGPFQIEANGQIKQTQDIGYYFTRYYIFEYANKSAQLQDLVKRFGVRYPDLLLITLNTTKEETFYSWTQ